MNAGIKLRGRTALSVIGSYMAWLCNAIGWTHNSGYYIYGYYIYGYYSRATFTVTTFTVTI